MKFPFSLLNISKIGALVTMYLCETRKHSHLVAVLAGLLLQELFHEGPYVPWSSFLKREYDYGFSPTSFVFHLWLTLAAHLLRRDSTPGFHWALLLLTLLPKGEGPGTLCRFPCILHTPSLTSLHLQE